MWGCSWAPNPLPSCPPQLEPEPEGLLPTVTQPCPPMARPHCQAGPLQLAEFASAALDPLSVFLPPPPAFYFGVFQTYRQVERLVQLLSINPPLSAPHQRKKRPRCAFKFRVAFLLLSVHASEAHRDCKYTTTSLVSRVK